MKTDYGIPESTVEMAFPKTPYAGLNLNPGDKLALNIIYHRVNANQNQWATTFDLYDFAEFTRKIRQRQKRHQKSVYRSVLL